MNIKTHIAVTLLATLANQAFAENLKLINTVVRVQASGVSDGPITGKLTKLYGCLYVNFDKPTKGGFQAVRLSEVQSLQVFENGGWMGRSVKNLLKQEPRQCFEAANG